MTSPLNYRWLTVVCCVSPFFALICFAVGNICGTAVGSAGLISLVMLCGQICSCVLGYDGGRTATVSESVLIKSERDSDISDDG